MPDKYLVVNADDFGLSPGVNAGILQACQNGIVTSASLMVRAPAAQQAVSESHERCPKLSLGLHLDLGEWIFEAGAWRPLYLVTDLDDPSAVETEILGQLEMFRSLVKSNPSHIDSHQHVHQQEPVRTVLWNLLAGIKAPVRHFDRAIQYCGGFYGQTGTGIRLPDVITTAALIKLLSELPPGVGELACHPGFDDALETMYRAERAEEVAVLCDPAVSEAIREQGIQLVNFREAAEISSSLPVRSP